ncbi:hypothetical protein [Streptomyces sp. NBC_00258]|uniref:hypothetical protein n=1 Tax=Streptomyces sp. NBC_00258 TaxID=2903642 RepID=UPI002E2D95B5|nr:hypothetical protein [Streptomyces sp. NBC_00258]
MSDDETTLPDDLQWPDSHPEDPVVRRYRQPARTVSEVAEQGDLLSICLRLVSGSPEPSDVAEWLNQASRVSEPNGHKRETMLNELQSHLKQRGPAWKQVAQHEIFRRDITTLDQHMPEWLGTAATVTVTATVLPFMQSLATQAGARMFEVARAYRERYIRHRTSVGSAVDQARWHSSHKITVQDTASGVSFVMPDHLPNDALQALATADLLGLAAAEPDGGKVVIYWDAQMREWRRKVSS